MNIIRRILRENPNAIFVFDVDGVLASYEYENYNHGYPEYVWENLIQKGNPYQYARPFDVMIDFIALYSKNCYACSVSSSDNESWMKKDFLIRNYDIPEQNIFFVDTREEKLDILGMIESENIGIDPHHIVMIEDTVDTLNYIRENSHFSTIHISSFFDLNKV